MSTFSIVYQRVIPVHLESELNTREHWTKSSKRHKRQRMTVTIYLRADRPTIKPPCTIELCRIAPQEYDYDNLVGAFKYVKDAIAEYIHPGLAAGRADDDKTIQWKYSQRKGKSKQYLIEITVKK